MSRTEYPSGRRKSISPFHALFLTHFSGTLDT